MPNRTQLGVCASWMASCCTTLACLTLLIDRGTALADEPTTVPAVAGPALHIAKQTPPQDTHVTDAEIGQSIEKGQNWLMNQFAVGKLKDFDQKDRAKGTGADALAVYALLQCGMATNKTELDPKDPFMKGLLDVLKSLPVEMKSTYTRGIRITALAVANRKEDQGVMANDVEVLLDSCRGGSFSYDPPPNSTDSYKKHEYAKPYKGQFDNSNSQYGLLGVWSAAEVGAEISDDFWQAVEKHWTECQGPDGQWGYGGAGADPQISWTLAGLASLFVCHEYLDSAKFGTTVARQPFSSPVAKGLAWLEAGDNSARAMGYVSGYGRYGMERVGLASGFKYFGSYDWYREVATRIVHEQKPDGMWPLPEPRWFGSDVTETAYNLLFLARGRHPILANKLRFEHFWNNRPRDLANLCKYANHELENPFNWQVVTLQHDWTDWTDSPVLYIASHEAIKLTDADYAKIRGFVYGGGLLFTQSDGSSTAFNDFVENVMVGKLFGDYELTKIPENHDLYRIMGTLKTKPALKAVNNGARLFMVHSPRDIAIAWQQKASKSRPDDFQIGLNLFLYATGKSDFRNRLSASFIPIPPAAAADNTIKVARVRYNLATWDPEPYAWTNFANWMVWETSIGIVTVPVDMEKLGDISPAEMPLAHLTGTNPCTPTEAQLKALKQYVDDGGTLFIDCCGGAFGATVGDEILAKGFPDAVLQPLAEDAPPLKAAGEGMVDIGKPKLRRYAIKAFPAGAPPIRSFASGKGRVIYSELDMTNALLDSRTWGIQGYATPWAQGFMRNLVFWTARGAK